FIGSSSGRYTIRD
ncbi:hypothetical protein D043_3942B, partial [Vibrio parahaemolyticus EKP-021]